MKHKFWHFYNNSLRKLAEYAPEMDEETWELVICLANEGHRSCGKRVVELSVVLSSKHVEDFVWTWFGDCLVQEHVLQFFREQRYTGFEVKPVKARFKKEAAGPPPRLWELVVTGWGGMAPPESGVRLTYRCPSCGRQEYTLPTDPGKLIDEQQWDGSDFFIVWPLPGYRFTTDRVARAIREHQFTGVQFTALENLDFNNPRVSPGLSPGRLSWHMPEPRARELGEPLGIY